jgi:hypothetical protein
MSPGVYKLYYIVINLCYIITESDEEVFKLCTNALGEIIANICAISLVYRRKKWGIYSYIYILVSLLLSYSVIIEIYHY